MPLSVKACHLEGSPSQATSYKLHMGMPKIKPIFLSNVPLVYAFDFALRHTPTQSAQAPHQHHAGGGVARPAVVGDSIWAGTRGCQDHREHGGGAVADRQPPTATAPTSRTTAAQDAHASRDRANDCHTGHHDARGASCLRAQHSTRHCANPSGTRGAHGSRDSTGCQLRQAGLPQRLAAFGGRRHCHLEVFNWRRWPCVASRD